ncbi:MAG TPA: phosphate/phosphite/phosphonate ABC transporter substrate-binding protein [Rhodopila sp.]|nr:phosphate/phosphite/phosphonate ABC transporter substrate-binding protein [Rhodopila sp.]
MMSKQRRPDFGRRIILQTALAAPLAAPLAARIFAIGSARGAEPLRVGMVPDAGATQVSIREKDPLRNFLAAQIGGPVELIIPTSYNATVEGLGNGSLDVAYLGGLTYVKARERYKVVPLVQRKVDQQFHSVMIAHAGSGIHSIADLKGKSFAFGDINSTSGHLFAYLAMKQAGLNVRTDLKSTRYTGSHTATAQTVASGVADAGSLDETVLHGMLADGKIPANSVYIFYTSPPFADYVWVARAGLPAATQDKVAGAFLGLKAGRDDAILQILRAGDFVRANDAEYDQVRQVGHELGLL